MSDYIRSEVFSGRFPLRAYMYILRPFTRVNKISKCQTDQFVKAISGKGISIRNIERLSYAYFRGGEVFKRQIEAGKIQWILTKMKHQSGLTYSECSELNREETIVIKDLEIFQKYMFRLCSNLSSIKNGSETYHKTLQLLLEGILENIDNFKKEATNCYDRREYSKNR